jgi:putative transposase
MFYQSIHTSKQAVHQLIERQMRHHEQAGYLSKLVSEIRHDHPTLSCRAMYHKLHPINIGRDAFEQLCKALGFTVERKLNLHRTTDSSGVIRFPNLLESFTLTHINQAWSSDITYYEIKGIYYYITFVMDCYSRRILGHQVSRQLTTEQTTLPALQQAIKTRGGQILPGIIFHSDGGGQYYDKEFLKYTALHQMQNSMCEYAYENGKAERLNGIIKNNYLIHYPIHTYEQLKKYVDRSVTLYNTDRPHKALKYHSPVNFENNIVSLQHQLIKEKITVNVI